MAVWNGYTVNDHGVKVPNPGRHPATAGNHRLARVLVVKDAGGDHKSAAGKVLAGGKSLKGKGGGHRRKPNPADGEILADKLVMTAFARKAAKGGAHTRGHDGGPMPSALGTSVFDEDRHDVQAGRLKQEAHSRGLICLLAGALASGALSLDDLYASHDARTVRRVMAFTPGH